MYSELHGEAFRRTARCIRSPWVSPGGSGSVDANFCQPDSQCTSNDLPAIVRADVLWFPVLQQKRIEGFKNLIVSHSRVDGHAQSLTGVLIQYGQQFVRSPIYELVVNEVDAQDVTRILRP